MFKRLFVVVLFMVLSLAILPEIAKADAYEYENINELADSVANVINRKSTYTFKRTFKSTPMNIDFDITVNWKNKTVTFNGFIFREETVYKREKFSAVLYLETKKVKTSSKVYKQGNDILNSTIGMWNFENDNECIKSLGHYLLSYFGLINKDTTISKSGDKAIISRVGEANDTIYHSTIITDKSKVLEMGLYSEDNSVKIKLK